VFWRMQILPLELFDKNMVRDPTDLVKRLGISLPQAEELFNAIDKARSITIALVLEVSKRLGDLIETAIDVINKLESHIKTARDVMKEINNATIAAGLAIANLKKINLDELGDIANELKKINIK